MAWTFRTSTTGNGTDATVVVTVRFLGSACDRGADEKG
jgi:hypothetical protein